MEGPFEKAERRITAAHAEDPRRVTVQGETVPWSVYYHRRLAHFTDVLAPGASVALKLAARCAHIRRWTIPREDYDEGRSGYKRWRSDLARFHAEQAAVILDEAGFDAGTIQRVQDILQKRRLTQDPEVQIFEDALCLVFIEDELAAFADKHDEAKLIRIIQKTWRKMSDQGHEKALELASGLSAEVRAILDRALAG